MSRLPAIQADAALLALDAASADTALYQGKAIEQQTGLECDLTVTARWGHKQDIHWVATFTADLPELLVGGHPKLDFVLQGPGHFQGHKIEQAPVSRWKHAAASGWLESGSIIGEADQPVETVQLRWVNLSSVGPTELLVDHTDAGPHYWLGRQKLPLGDWEMTLDERPHLGDVVADLKDEGGHAVTHLATLRRLDGEKFTADVVNPVLRAYQLAVSFAIGREAAPGLAMATDSDGTVLWREWSVRRADQMGGVTAWWHRDAGALGEVTRTLGPLLLEGQWSENARIIVQGCIASKRNAFVEQRISTGFQAMERLCWQRNVLEGRISGGKYNDLSASERIEGILVEAKVPLTVPDHLTVLSNFAEDQGRDGVPLDGPNAVTRVRNRITHPKKPEHLYGQPGLITDTMFLLSRYLEMLILHWADYQGKVQDSSDIRGWSGTNLQPVPWV